ncbi:MAG: hypothetical protein R3325_09435 [Thermoanaerobaculia bacterium]|nr:hypothetical protein [Thermoanaerobaculia bacterium]
MNLISQLNLWFIGPPEYKEYRLNGRWMVPFEPLLGYTSSHDLEVLLQEMEWLHRYTGRDGSNFIYSLEWIKPGGILDTNLQGTFLKAITRSRARWYLFYDPILAVRQRGLPGELPIDFSIPEIRKLFSDDLDYLERYFSHPQYWKVNGRPAMHVWAVPDGLANVDDAFREALDRGIYLIGDVFGRGGDRLPPLSAKSGFVIVTPEMLAHSSDWTVPGAMPFFEKYFTDRGGLDLIPAFSCQYDDTEFMAALPPAESRAPIRVLARDRGEIEDFLRLAQRHAAPIADGDRYIFCGTIDNWAEGTTLLPTKRSDPPFWDIRGRSRRIGFYHFEHLAALREVLFPEVAPYQGPRLEAGRRGRSVLFHDCDRMGRLRLSGRGVAALANPPEWSTGSGISERFGSRRRWRPRWKEGASPAPLRLRFRNLDGRVARLRLEPGG